MRTKAFMCFVAYLIALSGPLQAQDGPLTLEDIVTLRQVVSARLSPSGDHIAYILDVPRVPYVNEDGSAYRELHITDLEGNSRGYITGEVNIGAIDWSPDGQTVYYLAERNEDDEYSALYSIPLAGGESQRLFSHDANIRSYSPSPDGRHIAFLATPAGPASDLQWPPDGGRYLVALAPTARVDDAAWSPNSRELAFIGAADISDPLAGRIVVAAANGEGMRTLTPEYPGHVSDIAWRDDEATYRYARTSRDLPRRRTWKQQDRGASRLFNASEALDGSLSDRAGR